MDTNYVNTNNFGLQHGVSGYIQGGPARSTANSTSAPYPTALNTWVVASVSIDANGNAHLTEVAVNGMGQSALPGTAYTAAAALNNIAVGGATQANDTYADMDWTEFVVISGVSSDADRKAWEVYLGTANGLPVYGYYQGTNTSSQPLGSGVLKYGEPDEGSKP